MFFQNLISLCYMFEFIHFFYKQQDLIKSVQQKGVLPKYKQYTRDTKDKIKKKK